MQVFVTIVFVVIIGMHYVIYRRLAVAPRWPRRVRTAIGAGMVLLVILLLSSWRSLWAPVLSPDAARPLAWVGMSWLAFGLYLSLGLLVVAIVAGVLVLRGNDPLTRVRVNRAGSLAALAGAAATTVWGLVSAANPEVTRWTVEAEHLPEQFDGTTIVLLSDLHIGAVNSDRLTRELVDAANAAEPDIVVLAGDLVEGSPSRYGYQLAPLADLEAELGVYAVTGNHEFISGEPQAWIDIWQELGITVLQNESATIEQDGAVLHIAGVHDAMGEGEWLADPEAALDGLPAGDFTLYVAHQPSQAEDAQGLGIDLQLSGHTHGGQLWPMHYAVLASQPMLGGRAMVGDVDVLTSRGAAAWGPPVRVGAPPEIPVITLTR